MNPTRTAGVAVLGLVLLTATGCGSKDVVVSGTAAPAASAPQEAASSAQDVAGTSAFTFPDLPSTIVVPDVTAFTQRSQQYAEKLGDLAGAPTSGVLVAGARCDAKGRVINTPSLTFTDNGDGSGVYSDADRTVTNGGDGSGVYSDADKTITINGDGSGVWSDADKTITINADGSGVYSDAAKTVTVNGDGSGVYSDADLTLTINADGSGTYSDAEMTVTVDPDGSGDYSDASTTVTSNGDGTGTIDGAAAKVDPFPLFRPVGKFPPVKSLKPLGKSCGTLIRLDARVLFDFDSDTLRPEAGAVLDKVAVALKGVTVPIQVNGHTDAKGSDSYNQDLSERRARTVADALAQRGVGADLVAKGFGETQPIAANELKGKDNPAGRALNRRVELVIPN